ncbi:MAG TPA: STAS domain-containing protein [Gammaproteobacteria bacterium]|nr:STAS domain-containing protein [Gammaproteobacteria bacterium]
MSAAQLQEEGHTLKISGDLNRETVPDLMLQLQAKLQQHPGEKICINLEGVSRSDSAGLALLVECRRLMRLQQGSLCFEALPEQMQHMAEISGLMDFLH